MTKELRQQCEVLSLELFGNKNTYRKLEKRGMNIPSMYETTGQVIINVKFNDNEVLAFLQNYKRQKDEHELSKQKTEEPV